MSIINFAEFSIAKGNESTTDEMLKSPQGLTFTRSQK